MFERTFASQKISPGVHEEELDEWQGGTFDETDAIVLHRFFEKHADKVGKELLSLSKSSNEGEAAVIGGKKAWDTLCAALVEMGQPLEIPRMHQETAATHMLYREFTGRLAERNTESVAKLFTHVATKVRIWLMTLQSERRPDFCCRRMQLSIS